MLNGFAASEQIISRAMIQEVAETFDVLPRIAKVEERESPARIFPAASRAELWSIGKGNGNGRHSEPVDEPSEFVRISPEPDADIIFNEHARSDSETSIDELGAAFRHSGLGRGNNGQSL